MFAAVYRKYLDGSTEYRKKPDLFTCWLSQVMEEMLVLGDWAPGGLWESCLASLGFRVFICKSEDSGLTPNSVIFRFSRVSLD